MNKNLKFQFADIVQIFSTYYGKTEREFVI